MIALTAIAVVAAPLIFGLYSISVSKDVDADLFRSAGTMLTRIFLVQILFYGLTGVGNAYLQSRRRFFVAAWSPILPNLVIIATLLSLPDAGDTEWGLQDVLDDQRLRWTLGLGATLGIASMALVTLPAMFAAGLRYRPVFEWKHPAVRKLLVLSGWTIGFVAANQVAVVVIRNLATHEGEGILSAYVDAFTWFVLPYGLLAVSIATTFQPELARAVLRRDRPEFVRRLSQGARLITLLTLPAAAGLFVLRDPIIGLMQRGQFDPVASENTARALAGLAIGLVAFSVYLFTIRGFYAHHDTRTPFVLNVGENLLNIVFAFLLVGRWGVLGLGLAYSFAYLLSAAWALQVMAYKVPAFAVRTVVSDLWRWLLASAPDGGGDVARHPRRASRPRLGCAAATPHRWRRGSRRLHRRAAGVEDARAERPGTTASRWSAVRPGADHDRAGDRGSRPGHRGRRRGGGRRGPLARLTRPEEGELASPTIRMSPANSAE